MHAVCLRTRSPLFTCTGHSGHMWLVAYVPCNAIVGFLKQECGQQQAILSMGPTGGRMQLQVVYGSTLALDNISAAPNNHYVAFQESEAETGHGVIVSVDTKAVCYHTDVSHLEARGVSWRAAWSADSKWVIWYVCKTSNGLRSPCLLVHVATWRTTQLFSTVNSVHCVVWNRDVCSCSAEVSDGKSDLGHDVWLLTFVWLPQVRTSFVGHIQWCKSVTGLCALARRWWLLPVCFMLLPCLCRCMPFFINYV